LVLFGPRNIGEEKELFHDGFLLRMVFMKAVLAIDQGTTSSRALVIDAGSRILGQGQLEFPQYFPQPGWVEHDPEEIWDSQARSIQLALKQADLSGFELSAIGITNQRETVVVWDRKSGKPVYPAIVWQDRRTADQCQRLRAAGTEDMVRAKTGLLLDPYFSATKIGWILDHVDGARKRAEAGELAFGTIDSWLLWKLTGGSMHGIDASNASRTLLYNLHDGDWDPELLELFQIPAEMLPMLLPSSGLIAEAKVAALAGVAISGIAGDQQAALFGQGCFTAGQVKNTYGTGCFMLMNTGDVPVFSENRLLSTVAWCIEGELEYALEGSVFVGGAVVQWLRDGLGIIDSAEEIEALAMTVPDTGGVTFVPAFAGLGAPHWQAEARGNIFGITRGTTKAHLARAALEAIAFQSAELMDCMRKDAESSISQLRISTLQVDGGSSRNDLLMQLQADVIQAEVVRPAAIESSALGAAYLAGLATGFWPDKESITAQRRIERSFAPTLPTDALVERRKAWDQAVAWTRSAIH